MTIINRSISLALGAGIVLTPVFALAQGNEASTTTKTPLIHSLLNRIENLGEKQKHTEASTSVRAHASTTAGMHLEGPGIKGRDGMKNSSSTSAHIEARADAGLDARIKALQKISDRIDAAKRVSTGVKTSLTATLATQIQELTVLKAKIGNDTSISSMRDDAGKIRPEFRTYALVVPKTAIIAGSDRVLAIATQMDVVGAKLNARITEVGASGAVNVSSAQKAYDDYTAKVADAKVQANAAAALVVNLVADNGDKTVFAANATALKAAEAKLKTAQADLKAARTDIVIILKAIKGTGVRAQASSTVDAR